MYKNDLNKSYNIVTRGIAYSGRMLSQQFGDVVRKSRYENLEKVYCHNQKCYWTE